MLCSSPVPTASLPLCIQSFTNILPLGLLGVQEALENLQVLLQRAQPGSQLLLHLGLVAAGLRQLGVKVLAVRGRAHGGAEDGLDEEAVVRLERVAVSRAERCAEFFIRLGQVLAESLSSEVQGTDIGDGYNVSLLSP